MSTAGEGYTSGCHAQETIETSTQKASLPA